MTITMIDGLLPCARCKGRFPPEAFHRNRRLSTGYDCYCRDCRNAYCREWLEKQPEGWKRERTARTREWEKKNPEARARHLAASLARKASTREANP